ncbi:hypothetical protein ON010_g14024 [Phytophthora cinnamomi]|nr:hypothetical protein ON010_g14024 [Phytophthora cinnamomi]
MHDTEVDKIAAVIKNACKLASTNFPRVDGTLHVQTTVLRILEDDIPARTVKKGGQAKRMKVLECLFHVNGATHITQLCLHLLQLGGVSALKALGTRALQRANSRHGGKGNSFFVFAATCFVLASRDRKILKFAADDDDVLHAGGILESITAKLEKQSHRHRQHRLTPRQLCLVLKMVSTFIGAIPRSFAGRQDVSETMKDVFLRTLECAIQMLPSETVAIPDDRLTVEVLKVVNAMLSQMDVALTIPHNVYKRLLEKLSKIIHFSSVNARDGCIEVLKALSLRAEAGAFAGDIFKALLELVLVSDDAVPGGIASDGWGGMARLVLFFQQKKTVPHHVSLAAHSSFVGADFESIMSLFQSSECDGTEWNRVCQQIMSRIEPNIMVCSNSDVLLGAIRQAAAWCVQNRLRTHFGGPAQSFSSIERLVQEYSEAAQSLPEGSGHLLSKFSHHLTKWMMLEFVTALEMFITRTIYTTEVDHSNPDSDEYKTALFFRTNKVVCDDWLTRIRPFLVEMSRNGTSYELCRYHSHAMVMACYNKLSRTMASFATRGFSEKGCNELKQAEKDMDVALFFLCRCLCDAKDVDAIVGFQKWGESVSSALTSWCKVNQEKLGIDEEQYNLPLFRWLSAVRYEADMRYEDAATEYEALLQPVLSTRSIPLSSVDTSAGKILESPMTYLRISSQALLGCFKQCAKCYASLREWSKLREFASQFIELAESLANYDFPIEGIQAIFDCSDMWNDEIGTIRSLEASTRISSDGSGLMGDPAKRASLALRIWDVLGDSDAKPTNHVLRFDNVANRLHNELIPLALQPSPWNGYAGDKIGKKAEESLLRMIGLSIKSQLFSTVNQQSCRRQLKLNPEEHDSVVWSQPFCLDENAGSADRDCLYLTAVARLARKQHNFGFARHLLRDAASLRGIESTSTMAVSYEKAKLLETIGMEDEGRHLLETQCETSLVTIISGHDSVGQESSALRSLLRLAAASANSDTSELLSPATLRFLEGPVASFRNHELPSLRDNSLSDMQDVAAHKYLEAAITISPKSSKAWIRYSNWCYDRGKQEIAGITEQNGYIHLEPSDESQVNTLLDEIGVGAPDRDLIIRAFCHFLENGELISPKAEELRQLCTDQASPNHESRNNQGCATFAQPSNDLWSRERHGVSA